MSNIEIPGYSVLMTNRFYARSLPGGTEFDLVHFGKETVLSAEDLKKLAVARAKRTLVTTLLEDTSQEQRDLRRVPPPILEDISQERNRFIDYLHEITLEKYKPYAGKWLLIAAATVDYSNLARGPTFRENEQEGFYFGLIESSKDGFSTSVKLDGGVDFPSLSAAKYLLGQGVVESSVFRVSNPQVTDERVLHYLRLAKRVFTSRDLVAKLKDFSSEDIETAICSLIQGYAAYVNQQNVLELKRAIKLIRNSEGFAENARLN